MKIQNLDNPLIIQSDNTLLLDVHNSHFEAARNDITPFAELEKSPEHIHTYKVSPLSLWNAASAGLDADNIIKRLEKWSRFDIPDNIIFRVRDIISRFGKLILEETDNGEKLLLRIDDKIIIAELSSIQKLKKYLIPVQEGFLIDLVNRGSVKLELIKIGYPVKDEAPLIDGDPMAIDLRETTKSGFNLVIRDYQIESAKTFCGDGKAGSGFGVIVLPCGSGKTIVGIKVMEILKTNTLILTTNVAAVHQWIAELLDKTHIPKEDIDEYTGYRKVIKPVTVATYQILTWRSNSEGDFPHFSIFRKKNWGLIIYDEVHLLPAPVFRVTAEIQSMRRLGLTATLIREDGRQEDVFSLVGPKRYDVPWKEMEEKGWIAEANCYEIRITLPDSLKIKYAVAEKRKKIRIASENPRKKDIVKLLIKKHKNDAIIIIGQYIEQLKSIAKILSAPLITGKTPNPERERIYATFREGKEKVIVVSKVANFAIDLPDASVAIQISGTFGSRQEEAQRLGRILRPKEKNSYFYSLVSRHTSEEEFALNRQKFLTEQGYKYKIEMRD